MSGDVGILARPLQPDPDGTCPRCDRRRALVFVRREPDDRHEWIDVYRCRWCEATTEFAWSTAQAGRSISMTSRQVRTASVALPVAVLALGLAAPRLAAEQSPYAGLEGREIKALSAEEIEQYRSGEGMGFGLAAELNDYPGPRHVLELAADLELSAEQRAAAQAAYDAMHAEAVRLGEAIVERERRLDALFAVGAVTPEVLRAALEEIGRLQAELRFVHLAAHLETRRILTPAQVERYVHLRGYAGAGAHAHDHHGHGHR